MFKIIKKFLLPFGPSLLCLGVFRYQQRKYKAAHKNLRRGIQLYPPLEDIDLVDQAYLLLTEFQLGDITKLDDLKEMSFKLKNYEKDRDQTYSYAIKEINRILEINN